MTVVARRITRVLTLVALISGMALAPACGSATAAGIAAIPAPAVDIPLTKDHDTRMVVFSGGCFWGVQAVFQHVRGVTKAISGYAGGSASTAEYELVSTGTTGHAESVEVMYDASQVTIGQLLRVFFSVAHDPTELNRQGPDSGTQYRSAIFFATPDQERVAQAYISQLDASGAFGPQKIVTQVNPLEGFYAAEAYHQDYARIHPDDLYIRINDAPKVVNLKRQFPELYVAVW
jgi:peptide-methionine (S)-S-oxide reductase